MVTRLRPSEVNTRSLYRSRGDRLVAGVCGGLGVRFGVDPIWFRAGFVVTVIAGYGVVALLYPVLWLVLPEEPATDAPTPVRRSDLRRVAGLALIAAGAIGIARLAFPWIGDFVWPLLMLAAGLVLLMGGGRHDDDT